MIKNHYRLFDNASGEYISKRGHGKLATSSSDIKVYRRLSAALAAVAELNIGRVPDPRYPNPGHRHPQRYLELVEVQEMSVDGRVLYYWNAIPDSYTDRCAVVEVA